MKSYQIVLALILGSSIVKAILINSGDADGPTDIKVTVEPKPEPALTLLSIPPLSNNPQLTNNTENKFELQSKRGHLEHIAEELKRLQRIIEDDILVIDLNDQMFNIEIPKVGVIEAPKEIVPPLVLIGSNKNDTPTDNLTSDNKKVIEDEHDDHSLAAHIARLLEDQKQAQEQAQQQTQQQAQNQAQQQTQQQAQNQAQQQPPVVQEQPAPVQTNTQADNQYNIEDSLIPPEAIEAVSLLSPEELIEMEKRVAAILANYEDFNVQDTAATNNATAGVSNPNPQQASNTQLSPEEQAVQNHIYNAPAPSQQAPVNSSGQATSSQ